METAPAKRPYAPRLPPEERREQLLDAAMGLIIDEGYGGVSMEGIARRAGVTKPVVYDQFGNLGALLQALLQREESRAMGQLAQVVPTPPADADPDRLLADRFGAFLRTVIENADTWRLILLPVNGTPQEVQDHVERGRRAVLAQLEQLTAWGLERRGGPPGLDSELLARSILVFGEQAARLVLTDGERFPPERIASFVATGLASLGDRGPGV